jgi:ABC-2 type transport system ATP-binding protein
MIRAQGLVKNFGPVRALDGLSFEAEPGEIYGLLGPNGAGKTTAMRLLSALLPSTSGTALVAGYAVDTQPREVRARIGILTEVPGLYLRLTPSEYLDFFAQVHGIRAASERSARVEEMLRLVGLWDRRRSVMRTFSKGMQQRVAIARTLVQDPPVLLLDEPTAALDPEAARTMRDYVSDLAASRGRTILLCTHNLFEAEQLCHRLSIVKSGRQVAEGTPAELTASIAATCVLRVRERSQGLVDELRQVVEIEAVKVDGPGAITYRTRNPDQTNPAVIRAAVAAGADVVGLAELTSSLEEVYLAIMAPSGGDVGFVQALPDDAAATATTMQAAALPSKRTFASCVAEAANGQAVPAGGPVSGDDPARGSGPAARPSPEPVSKGRPTPGNKTPPNLSTGETPEPAQSTHEMPQPSPGAGQTPEPGLSTYGMPQPNPGTGQTPRPALSTHRMPQPSSGAGETPELARSTHGMPQPSSGARHQPSRWELRGAWLVARRELRETLRDPNLVLPLVLMPCFIGLLTGITAFASFGANTGAVGTAVTNAALDRLPAAAVEHLGNVPTSNRAATLELLLKAFSIPLFWVIPVALTPALAADSFVGERERASLEPLLATPIGTGQLLLGKLVASVIPAAVGTWLGVLVFWAMTLLSPTTLYPRMLLGDGDWLFSLLVVAPLVALFTASVAALISTRVSGYRVAYQLNGLVALPVVLLLIPATAFLFLITGAALVYIALLVAVVDVGVVAWSARLFNRERLLSRR